MIRTWVLELPYTRPPLSLNDRTHWARRAKLARELRHWTSQLARAQAIPALDHVRVELHYHPRDNRRRDADNLFATVKPCVDGLRDAGIVVDDDTTRVTHLQPVIHPATGGKGRLELHMFEGRPELTCRSCGGEGVLDAGFCMVTCNRCHGQGVV